MLLPTPQITAVSESAWLIQFNTHLSLNSNLIIQQLAAWLRLQHFNGLKEVIPSYDSLLVGYDIDTVLAVGFESHNRIVYECVEAGLDMVRQEIQTEGQLTISIPVCHDASLGNDLQDMSAFKKLDIDEIVALHCSILYHVFLLGFLPGFAYMGTVDERIAVPRKSKPTTVKAGAVGIAGNQTGIYPLDSPGGWNIVGYTPLKMFDASRSNPALLQPGMQVQFVPISLTEYKSLLVV